MIINSSIILENKVIFLRKKMYYVTIYIILYVILFNVVFPRNKRLKINESTNVNVIIETDQYAFLKLGSFQRFERI